MRAGELGAVRWGLVAAVVSAAVTAFPLYSWATFDPRPPVVGGFRFEVVGAVRNGAAAPLPVRAGEAVVIRSHREKWRDDCPLTSVRWAQDVATGLSYALPSRAWAGGAASAEYVDLAFDTAALPPGSYNIGAVVTYACPPMFSRQPPIQHTYTVPTVVVIIHP